MAPATDLLTAAEAAARLGVKRQTLYAYVSRGLLTRTLSLDGRTSLYDPREVAQLRTKRRRHDGGKVETVIATHLTRLDEDGHQYRDVPVADLVATPFEAVADHLWGHEGPWILDPEDRDRVLAVQALLPEDTPLLDRLRTSVTTLSAADPLRHDPTPAAHCRAGRRMLIAMVDGLPSAADPSGSRLADRLWVRLTPMPSTESQRDSLNAALVLLADHGLAASTFAARVAASVRADPYSVVHAGLGAVGGVLHGAASEAVHRLLVEAEEVGPQRAVGRRLASGQRIPGVGHTVYEGQDPREVLLATTLEAAWSEDPRLELVRELRGIITERVHRPINVDFALGTLTWLAGMDAGAGQCIFVARTAGWIAHGIEELDEPPVRFRPVARYVPTRSRLPEDE